MGLHLSSELNQFKMKSNAAQLQLALHYIENELAKPTTKIRLNLNYNTLPQGNQMDKYKWAMFYY